MARSTRDLANILHNLDAQSCGLTSLGESWCDTTDGETQAPLLDQLVEIV